MGCRHRLGKPTMPFQPTVADTRSLYFGFQVCGGARRVEHVSPINLRVYWGRGSFLSRAPPQPKLSTSNPKLRLMKAKNNKQTKNCGPPMKPFPLEKEEPGRTREKPFPAAPRGNRGEREGGGLLHSSPGTSRQWKHAGFGHSAIGQPG